MTVRVKDPGAIEDFLFDLGPPCDRDGVTITGTPTVTATPSGLTVSSPAVVVGGFDSNGDALPLTGVKVRISGGTEGRSYALVCHAVVSNGEEFELTGTLRCQNT